MDLDQLRRKWGEGILDEILEDLAEIGFGLVALQNTKGQRRKTGKILDVAEAWRLAADGMQRSEAGASEEVKAELLDAIYYLALRHRRLWSDLVWVYLGYIPEHAAASALGPMFNEAARRGWIVRANWLETERPTQHRRGIREWESLIYRLPPIKVVRKIVK